MSGEYASEYRRAQTDPRGFWGDAAAAVAWYRTPQVVLDDSNSPFVRWFPDGMVNACYNALDRHVEDGRAEQLALIHDSPVTGARQRFTYRELRDRVARMAGALRARGIGVGDRVVIYMPMVPEAVIAMLACARLGAVHSVVFGGFAANELAVRIDDVQAKLVIAASCGIEPGRVVPYKPLLDQAIELARHKPETCIILQREQLPATMIPGRDLDWRELEAAAAPVDCVPVAATHPLYVLYTSGTTGQPKGVVRDTGGCIVSLLWSMRKVYGVAPGDVFWAASDVGWVVGHSYIVYGPLFNGNTTILYEGKPVGTPDPGAYWRVIAEYGVKVFFTAPTAFRAIKKEDSGGAYLKKYDLSGFETLFLAGERCDPDTLAWAQDRLGVPVIDHWWQTELGWPAVANCRGIELLPVVPGSPTKPVPGFVFDVLDGAGKPRPPGEIGALVLKLPLPPGTFTTLWGNDERFINAYFKTFPGYYETGDAGYIDAAGYVFVMARTDDVINVAGHRLSTGAMEEVLAAHPDVAECAVIGVADAMKGQLPLGLIVLKDGAGRDPGAVCREAIQMVRERIGPVAAFKLCIKVQRLPKTRSGKVLRGTMRSIADGEPWKAPATIDDPAILDEIGAAFSTLGYPVTR
ncbi:MAG: propionyl-CoA synthetase [Gammaproteobacteria bacterium]|nr:propionyl-CoA synthetase [Gammaproteobacteria bacterium]